MIGYIRGTVAQLYPDCCYIDVQGIGYRVFVPTSTSTKLVVGKVVTVHTYLNVREDAMLLYGFYSQEEYDLFGLLMSVAGIGPKAAINILSDISPAAFRAAVSNKNLTALTKVSGIGKKTAERIVLELKDKIGLPVEDNQEDTPNVGQYNNDMMDDALQALTSLGYSQAEILPAVRKLVSQAESTEELIRMVLKEFVRR